jgi:hypothetical protein
MREVRISRPYDEEDDMKSFPDDHKSTGVPDACLTDSDAFEEEEGLQITEEQTVLATDAPTAKKSDNECSYEGSSSRTPGKRGCGSERRI